MKKNIAEGIRISIHLLLLCIILQCFSSCDPLNLDQGILSKIQKYQYVSIDFSADIKSNSTTVSFSSLSVDNTPPYGSTEDCPLSWSGVSFSTTFDYSWKLFSGEKVHSYGTISGTMSTDGTIIEKFTAHETSVHPETNDVYKYDITVINVPYQSDYEYNEYSPRFGAESAIVSQYIYAYTQSWDFTDSDGNQQMLYSTTVNYNDPEDEPYLHITFSGSN
jgi:hypothetical protein